MSKPLHRTTPLPRPVTGAELMALYPRNSTSGPWGIEQTPGRNWIGPMRADGLKVKEIVCCTDREGLRQETITLNDANARLIAAAPELIEVLSDMLMWIEDNCDDDDDDSQEARLREVTQRAEALIIKARGWPIDE